MKTIPVLVAFCLLAPFSPSLAGQRMIPRDDGPELLSSRPLPPPRETPYSNINQPPEAAEKEMSGRQGEDKIPDAGSRGWFFNRRRRVSAREPLEAPPSDTVNQGGNDASSATAPRPGEGRPETSGRTVSGGEPLHGPSVQGKEPEPAFENTQDQRQDAPHVDLEGRRIDYGPPPTPEAVNQYREKLELRLLERYNNLPDHAGRVAKVSVVLSRPLEVSLDGALIQAEFDQLVYDNWGKRIPDLEKEYYVVTFGSGGVRQVRSDPSIRVGLDLEKTYSETAPPEAEPFRNIEDNEAFRPTSGVKMPAWWRPDFPEYE